MDRAILGWAAHREAESAREDAGERGRETKIQDRRSCNADRPFKKIPRDAGKEEKRQFIRNHCKEFGSIPRACKAVGLSVSTYYYKPRIEPSERQKKDAAVRDLIEKVQAEFPFYGYRRVHWHLKKVMGETVNTKKIRRIMDEYGLKAVIWKGFRVKTTDSDHEHGYAPNLLPGKVITGVNQVWVTDITYICIATGFVYLAAILDLFSRKVIGWAISKSLHHSMCLEALKMAIETRKPPKGCIHHSDRGVQYACPGYREFAQKFGLIISMSAKGYCYDNAFMESWFKTLKAEEVYLTEYLTFADVIASVPKFIEAVYNSKRLHSSLGYFSPNEFEILAENGLLQKRGIQPVFNLPGEPSN